MDEIDKEANKILERELKENWSCETYENIRTKLSHCGFTQVYLLAKRGKFASSVKIEVMLQLAKLDLQKRTTIPELMFSCCSLFPKKVALEKLIELRNYDKEVVKSVLEFQNHEGLTCLSVMHDRENQYPSMLRDIEECNAYLIDLAKFFNLDSKKVLDQTAENRTTTRLLEENLQIDSVNDAFITPFFKVISKIISTVVTPNKNTKKFSEKKTNKARILI